MSTLKRTLPELLVEAGLVVLAILLALAADEWRESRQNHEIAERALAGIETEMRTNRAELLDSRDPNLALLEALQAEATDGGSGGALDIQFEYSLLSDAAWQTAQVTQAIHYADYGLVQQIARLYDLQELFAENQRAMVNELSGMSAITRDPQGFSRMLMGRLGIVMNVETGLMAVLDSMITVMENR